MSGQAKLEEALEQSRLKDRQIADLSATSTSFKDALARAEATMVETVARRAERQDQHKVGCTHACAFRCMHACSLKIHAHACLDTHTRSPPTKAESRSLIAQLSARSYTRRAHAHAHALAIRLSWTNSRLSTLRRSLR